MARLQINVTVNSIVGPGQYNLSAAPTLDPKDGYDTAVADAATALGDAGEGVDSTAAIQTIVNDLDALAPAIGADVSISFNTETVLTQSALEAAVRAALKEAKNYNLLS